MKFNHNWTTVTLFSKILAIILFVALPFGAFYLGRKYQQSVTIPNQCPILSPSKCPDKVCTHANEIKSQMSGVYIDNDEGFQFKIPDGWKAEKDPYFDIYSPDYASCFFDILSGANISISVDNDSRSLEELVKELKDDILNIPINPKYITIGGIKAFQGGFAHEGYGKFTDIIYKGKRYTVRIEYSYDQKDISPYINVYNELLKTFEFIK